MSREFDLKLKIIEAGYSAVEELIKVASEKIIQPILRKKKDSDEDEDFFLAADRMKNAAAAKKVAIFDAFEILSRIESEKENLGMNESSSEREHKKGSGFAERRAK